MGAATNSSSQMTQEYRAVHPEATTAAASKSGGRRTTCAREPDMLPARRSLGGRRLFGIRYRLEKATVEPASPPGAQAMGRSYQAPAPSNQARRRAANNELQPRPPSRGRGTHNPGVELAITNHRRRPRRTPSTLLSVCSGKIVSGLNVEW